MTLEAQHVHRRDPQQASTHRAMRGVATDAAVQADGRMLEHERPLFFTMAAQANIIFAGRGPQPAPAHGSVRIVAVLALYEAFVHAMAEWFAEFRFLLVMAAIAELRRLLDQERALHFSDVRRMAIDARHAVAGMGAARPVAVLLAEFVATQAAAADF